MSKRRFGAQRYHLLLSLILVFGLSTVQAQFNEDFSSGTLTTNGWQGEIDRFQINAEELQLFDMNPVSNNTTRLYAPVITGDSTQWSLNVRNDFSPSGSNFTEIALAAVDVNFTDGYFLVLGGISGNDDVLSLVKKEGGTNTTLISGTVGALGTPTIDVAIRVLRTNAGLWSLEADYSGGSNYVNEGSEVDQTFAIGSYFGILCKYTSTRADKFFFDNIVIGPEYIDNDPPTLINFSVVDSKNISLSFSEAINSSSIQSDANFQFSPSEDILNISLTSTQEINLQLENNFNDGTLYTLALSGILDESNNSIADTSISFEYLELAHPEKNEILISELMVDPSPTVGLPEVEYVELLNNSAKNFDLGHLIIADASMDADLPNFILRPNEYVFIYEISDEAKAFETFDRSLGINKLPSLGNTGDEISLIDDMGNIINSVVYTLDYYNDLERNDGGYSIELKAISNVCLLSDGWQASQAAIGGTPGAENSVGANSPVPSPFTITNIFPSAEDKVTIEINRALEVSTTQLLSYFSGENFSVVDIVSIDNQNATFELSLDINLEENELYHLLVSDQLFDCTNAPILGNRFPFGIPVEIEAGDLIINELLFNPYTGGSDFLEIYNTSDKILALENVFVANLDSTGAPSQVKQYEGRFLILPKAYIALTESASDIKGRYSSENPDHILEMDLPTYPDDEGAAYIYTVGAGGAFLELDRFIYDEDFHNPLIDNEDGVSLERISATLPSASPSTWRSASVTAGYATPAGPNSQQELATPIASENPFVISTLRLSPDGDGFEDFLSIQYADELNDYLASLRIYDVTGRQIKEIAQQVNLGSQGFFRWDGDTDGGTKAPMGIYVLVIERFNPSGVVEQFKETIVLAERLD